MAPGSPAAQELGFCGEESALENSAGGQPPDSGIFGIARERHAESQGRPNVPSEESAGEFYGGPAKRLPVLKTASKNRPGDAPENSRCSPVPARPAISRA